MLLHVIAFLLAVVNFFHDPTALPAHANGISNQFATTVATDTEPIPSFPFPVFVEEFVDGDPSGNMQPSKWIFTKHSFSYFSDSENILHANEELFQGADPSPPLSEAKYLVHCNFRL